MLVFNGGSGWGYCGGQWGDGVVEWGGIFKNIFLYARLQPYTKVQV